MGINLRRGEKVEEEAVDMTSRDDRESRRRESPDRKDKTHSQTQADERDVAAGA